MTESPLNDRTTILWRRLDLPGHDTAALTRTPDGWHLSGVAVLAESDRPCRVEYEPRYAPPGFDFPSLRSRCSTRSTLGLPMIDTCMKALAACFAANLWLMTLGSLSTTRISG